MYFVVYLDSGFVNALLETLFAQPPGLFQVVRPDCLPYLRFIKSFSVFLHKKRERDAPYGKEENVFYGFLAYYHISI